MSIINRRVFLTRSAGLAAVAALPVPGFPAPTGVGRDSGVKLKLALNAFSFDKPLRQGSMTLPDVVHFCAQHGIDALDATGYYFPGYPKVPPDEYVYNFKRTAFVNGVAISATGVNNNFAVADSAARNKDMQLIKDWIVVASKLGAPMIRVFSGPTRPSGYSFDEALAWMVADFKECASFGQQHGVVVALQQHNDFLKTAAEVIRVIEAVGSEWFACILDCGSLRSGDPYGEIEKLAPYAVSFLIKENVGRNGNPEPTDLAKIKAVIDRTGYRGYVPFEALGSADPQAKVSEWLEKIRRALAL